MNLSSFDLGSLLAFGLLAVMRDQVIFLFKVCKVYLCAFFVDREYNLDRDKSTADWCEGFNPGDGTWGLMKILEYRVLSVLVEMKSRTGVHQREIPILDWMNGKSSRRGLSAQQKQAIKEAGNDWPLSSDTSPSLEEILKCTLAEMKELCKVSYHLSKVERELTNWKEKRPIELGRQKKKIKALEGKIQALEGKKCCKDKGAERLPGATKVTG